MIQLEPSLVAETDALRSIISIHRNPHSIWMRSQNLQSSHGPLALNSSVAPCMLYLYVPTIARRNVASLGFFGIAVGHSRTGAWKTNRDPVISVDQGRAPRHA